MLIVNRFDLSMLSSQWTLTMGLTLRLLIGWLMLLLIIWMEVLLLLVIV